MSSTPPPLLVLSLTLGICACSYSAEDDLLFWSPPPGFALERSSPAPGQLLVPLESPIDLTFDAAPAAETIGKQDVRLYSGLIETPGEVKVDLLERRIRFRPSLPLRSGLRHQMYLREGIRSLQGSRLARTVVFDFTTGDGSSPRPPAAAPPPARTVLALWHQRCTGSCHAPPLPRAGVDLSSLEATRRSLSGVPGLGVDQLRLHPGDHARSYVMRKLLAEGGYTGLPMPPNGPALSQSDLRLIADWIDGGALP